MYQNACLRFRRGGKLSIVAVVGLAILSSFFLTQQAFAVAGINRTINFQGKLVGNTGLNVADDDYTVVFTIYDRDSTGTALWSETQTVTTSDGVFRVALGSQTAIPANFNFNWDGLYLGMKVNADSEMTPRIRLTAVPYAFNAEKVSGLTVQDESGNASTSGTLRIPNGEIVSFADAFSTSGANPLTLTTTNTTNATLPEGTITLVDLATNQVLTNKTIGSTGLTFSGAGTDITTSTDETFTFLSNGTGDIVLSQDHDSAVLIGSASNVPAVLSVSGGFGSNAAMIVNQTNSGDIFVASSSGVTRFVLSNSGNVGLGTIAPQARLDVIGGEGTTPIASFSAATAYAGLVVDQAGVGDVLTASTAGQMRFTVKQDGRLQLSSLVYDDSCTALETDANGYIICGTDAEGAGSSQWDDVTGGINYASGNVGIGQTTPIHKLHITATTNQKALAVINGDGLQDLFTASASGATKFLVDKTGNVGIGTTAPFGLLNVVGGASGSNTSLLNLRSGFNPANTGTAIRFTNSSIADSGYGGAEIAAIRQSDDTGDFVIRAWNLGLANLLRIKGATGYVGLLTDTPTAALDIAGATGASTSGILTFRGTTNPAINFLNGESLNFQSSVGGDTGLISRLFINGNTGYMGIGTTTPTVGKLVLSDSASALTVDAAVLSATTGTQTTGVDGLQIDFANAGSGAQTNSGLTINVTSNNTSASSIIYGLNVGNLSSGGESASEIGLRVGTGWDQGIIIESGGSTNQGLVYSGAGRPTKTITLSPEFAGAVLTASGSATTTGDMRSDASPSATFQHYYEWNSSETELQDYTIAVRVALPRDFDAWTSSNALQISYNTELTTSNTNKFDVIVYNESDATKTPVGMRTNVVGASQKTWTSVSIDDSELDAGNARDLDAANEVAVIYIKVYSKDDNYVQVGDITLNYLAKF